MADKITIPGVHDIPADAYHGNCCDGPSLSHSGARDLVEECPAMFWHGSPLNPAHVREEKRQFDFGSGAHLLSLEPDQWSERVVIVEGKTKDGKPSKGYTSDDAKAQRDGAYAAGKIPLLVSDVDAIHAMRARLLEHPIARKLFRGGRSERSYFWRDAATGVWLKCRPDREADDLSWLADYKTVPSVHPRYLQRRVFDHGHHSQAAWYLDGVERAGKRRPDHFFFVAQQNEEPHLVTVYQIETRAIEWGQMANRRAIDLFARCVAANDWPAYRDPKTPDRDTVLTIGLPGYAEFQLTDRMDAGEFDRIKFSAAQLQRAAEFQRPLA